MAMKPQVGRPTTRMYQWQRQLFWVLGAGVLGFAVTAVFSTLLRLSRDWFVAVYLVAVAPFVSAYVRWSHLSPRQYLHRHWLAGLVGAVILSGAMVFFVLAQQPPSPGAKGLSLLWAIVWLGIIYGVLDALLLNVLPVVATWQAMHDLGLTKSWMGKLGAGILALAASLFVTAAYHLGYAEYRGPSLSSPLFGNLLFTLGYVLTGNPLTPIVGHVALHIASAVHGLTTTVALPPHHY